MVRGDQPISMVTWGSWDGVEALRRRIPR